jgi:hypothetical protein
MSALLSSNLTNFILIVLLDVPQQMVVKYQCDFYSDLMRSSLLSKIAPTMATLILIGRFNLIPIVSKTCFANSTSFVSSDSAYYSASVDDNVKTSACFGHVSY